MVSLCAGSARALGQMAFDKSTKGDERENLINCLCRESVYANPLWYVSARARSLASCWQAGLLERSIYCNPVENISARALLRERVANISVVGREGDWNVTLSLSSLSYQSLPFQALPEPLLGSTPPQPPFTLLTFLSPQAQPRILHALSPKILTTGSAI